ncbi:MAG TPA: type II toxin-antitoxin system Phd/YefM family antitoxin [Chloroflexia bacterium]|nr:type II toxin-antitoxin system Phd/YefM family antitoxin [Chloroflexia bacterium]
MGKKISVSELRAQLGGVLDQLDNGQSHFIIERNNQEVAVLLSMDKFKDIMQMLELLNTLEIIETGAELPDPDDNPVDFPDISLLPPYEPAANKTGAPKESKDSKDNIETPAPRSRNRNGSSIEDMAAKLGIRIIK